MDWDTGMRGYLITGDDRFLESYHRGSNAYTARSSGQPCPAEPNR